MDRRAARDEYAADAGGRHLRPPGRPRGRGDPAHGRDDGRRPGDAGARAAGGESAVGDAARALCLRRDAQRPQSPAADRGGRGGGRGRHGHARARHRSADNAAGGGDDRGARRRAARRAGGPGLGLLAGAPHAQGRQAQAPGPAQRAPGVLRAEACPAGREPDSRRALPAGTRADEAHAAPLDGGRRRSPSLGRRARDQFRHRRRVPRAVDAAGPRQHRRPHARARGRSRESQHALCGWRGRRRVEDDQRRRRVGGADRHAPAQPGRGLARHRSHELQHPVRRHGRGRVQRRRGPGRRHLQDHRRRGDLESARHDRQCRLQLREQAQGAVDWHLGPRGHADGPVALDGQRRHVDAGHRRFQHQRLLRHRAGQHLRARLVWHVRPGDRLPQHRRRRQFRHSIHATRRRPHVARHRTVGREHRLCARLEHRRRHVQPRPQRRLQVDRRWY